MGTQRWALRSTGSGGAFRIRARPPTSPPTMRRSSANAPQRAGAAPVAIGAPVRKGVVRSRTSLAYRTARRVEGCCPTSRSLSARFHASWLRHPTVRTTGEHDARAAYSSDSVCCRHPRVQSELDPCACSPEARRHPAAALIARDEWLHPCGDREAHPPSGSTPTRAGRHSASGLEMKTAARMG